MRRGSTWSAVVLGVLLGAGGLQAQVGEREVEMAQGQHLAEVGQETETETETEQGWQVLSFAQVRIPYGSSTVDFSLGRSMPLGPLLVTREVVPGCGPFNVALEALDRVTGQWRAARFENGAFLPPVAESDWVRVKFFQYGAFAVTCSVRLNMMVGNQPLPPGGGQPWPSEPNRTLIGVMEYRGGFQERARLDLPAPLPTAKIEIMVPRYCQNLQILGGQALSGGMVTAGRIWGENPAFLLLPQVSPIDGLELTLVGPQGQACQLPVYVHTACSAAAGTCPADDRP